MQKTCPQCKTGFEILDSDLKFYDKISPVYNGKKYQIPAPEICPDCRQKRRVVHINQLNLYKRKDDHSGKEIISNYHSSSLYKVYTQEFWWGDGWDALEYGKDFDFNRPFFDQFQELLITVPKPNLFTGYQDDINCDYTNYSGKNKNCYLIFDADYCQDTYYSYSPNTTTNSLDLYRVRKAELCYEMVDCNGCYNCKYLKDSSNCFDSAFLDNCYGCKNCFMSFNLQHKEYYIYNKPSTKEEYQKFMAQLSDRKNVEKYLAEFKKLSATYPEKYLHGLQNENVSGDYLYNCKNVRASYDSNVAWDCAYIYQSFATDIKDSMDFDECGEFVELVYESSNSGYNLNNTKFSINCLYQNSNLTYCNHCSYSSYLFGCVGLKRKKYCIFNKQYTKEQYEELVPKIIEHMQKTGEWGHFFPAKLSPFGYNETLAADFYPMSKEQALQQGYKWLEDDKKKVPQTYQLPDDIKQTPDTITQEILACTECGSNFKIIPQEIKFYREKLIPVPNKCFKCRHYARLKSRNPRKLWKRQCDNCHVEIETSYAPDRPATPLSGGARSGGKKIYCEKCYLKIVI